MHVHKYGNVVNNFGNRNLDLRTFSYAKWWLKSILNQTVSKKKKKKKKKKTCRSVDI